jgi:nucleotide-binding universal stress UspA family protein
MSAIQIAVPRIPATQIRRILFATDFSEASRKALPLVAAIARKYGSEIYLANIWFPLPYTMGSPDVPIMFEAEQHKDALERTRKIAESEELAGFPKTVIVEQGDVGEEIEALVRKQNVDLVVLSTHGRTGWKHVLMGSVAEYLLRKLTCPVLTVGPRLSEGLSHEFAFRRILFPTDLSVEARELFPYFASLAAQEGGDIAVVHVLPEETGVNPDAATLAEPLRKDMESVYSRYVPIGCRAEFAITFGDPATRIVDLALARNVGLIGMGVRHASEVVTHFQNTIAYGVVLRATCPVLTCRAK